MDIGRPSPSSPACATPACRPLRHRQAGEPQGFRALCRERPGPRARGGRHRRDGQQPLQPQRASCPRHDPGRRRAAALPAATAQTSIASTKPSPNSRPRSARPPSAPSTSSGTPSAGSSTPSRPRSAPTTSPPVATMRTDRFCSSRAPGRACAGRSAQIHRRVPPRSRGARQVGATRRRRPDACRAGLGTRRARVRQGSLSPSAKPGRKDAIRRPQRSRPVRSRA
jgi:hypothetical protein